MFCKNYHKFQSRGLETPSQDTSLRMNPRDPRSHAQRGIQVREGLLQPVTSPQ